MARKITTLVLVLLVFTLFVGSSFAVDKESRKVVHKVKKLPKSAILASPMATTVYSTDFETEGEWSAVQLGTTGPSFQWVDDNSNSPTHSWWVADDTPMSADAAVAIETAVISPSIDLPAELDGSPIKGMNLSYYVDVQTPNTSDGDFVFDVFEMEIYAPYMDDNFWQVSEYQAYEGTGSSWWCGSDGSAKSYGPNWRQELWTPVLDLSAASGSIMLTFKNAPNSEPGFDYCFLEISNDGGTVWNRLARWDEEHDPVEWFDASFDITEYASADVVVRWRFASDGGYQSVHAWHIDNVVIADDATTFLSDDGGDSGATVLLPQVHPYAWNRMHYDYAFGDHLPPGWTLIDDAEIFNGSLDLLPFAGLTVKFRLRFSTDGWNRLGLAPGYGFYFDDFEISAVGKAKYDLGLLGANVLGAQVGAELSPTIYSVNSGTDAVSGAYVITAEIFDGEEKVATLFGQQVIDVAPDSVFGVQMANSWIPPAPGVYLMEAIGSQLNDTYPVNDTLRVNIIVPGGPYVQVLYQEDFDSDPTAATLEDFGFTVENGGGDAYGNNINTWELNPGFIYGAGPYVGWGWGSVDPGANFTDSSEVLEEGLVTPTIDISEVGNNNTINLEVYVYFRPSYPGYAQFGAQTSIFSIEGSVDDGASWTEVYQFVDDDSLDNGPRERLPHHRFPGETLGYTQKLDFALAPAVWNRAPGNDMLKIRFKLWSQNSWFVALNVDEILVYKGIGSPKIKSVKDIPEDNGKQVQVAWMPGMQDLTIWDRAGTGHPITHYNVWREAQVEPTAKPVADIKAMLAAAKNAKPGDLFVTADGMGWNYIESVPAMGWKMYSVVAPTLWDDVETVFMVSAHTDDITLFQASMPVGGTSTDDLAPAVPMSLDAVGDDDRNITVTWQACEDDDLQFYTVYRDGEAAGTTTETTWSDKQLDGTYIYTVSATDFAGNESDKSNEGSVHLATSVDDFLSAVPTEFGMNQNYPNPFNPETHINYSIPTASFVTVKVYNAAGQEIATLVESNQPAGNFQAVWNAADVSSGVYFYVINAADYSKTMKMVLMK